MNCPKCGGEIAPEYDGEEVVGYSCIAPGICTWSCFGYEPCGDCPLCKPPKTFKYGFRTDGEQQVLTVWRGDKWADATVETAQIAVDILNGEGITI